MQASRMNAPAPSRSLPFCRAGKGCGLILLGAFLCLGCGSQQDVPLYPLSSERAGGFTAVERISTAEEEAEAYWSSTYGNPRPKLTQTLSLGATDLPVSAPPPSAAVFSSDDSGVPTSSSVAQASTTTIIVVPTASRWDAGRERRPHARKLDSSRGPKHTYAHAPPRKSAPALPNDKADASTKRTSIVAPLVPRAVRE